MKTQQTDLHSYPLWKLAQEAANRAKLSDKQEAHDTKATVILACAAMDSLVNEYASLLAVSTDDHEQKISTVLSVLEDERASVVSKLKVLGRTLPGDNLEGDRPPLQDFMILVKLRNAIVHPKQQSRPPSWFGKFKSCGWTHEPQETGVRVGGWLSALSTPQVAQWAIVAARDIGINIIDRFEHSPDPNLKTLCKLFRALWDVIPPRRVVHSPFQHRTDH